MNTIDTAMLLAAGFGSRMRPLTETTPKPLIPLRGLPLLDWARQSLRESGISKFVVNTHYLADRIEAHVADDPNVQISYEDPVLETGGGIAKALPLLGPNPFVVVNADIVWTDGPVPAAQRLIQHFNPTQMDVLLLMHPKEKALGDYDGPGQYHLTEEGRLRRRVEGEMAPYLFAGVSIQRPELYHDVPDGAFSSNLIFDRAQANGRLFGLVHDGDWFHIGTPQALAESEAILAARGIGIHGP